MHGSHMNMTKDITETIQRQKLGTRTPSQNMQ